MKVGVTTTLNFGQISNTLDPKFCQNLTNSTYGIHHEQTLCSRSETCKIPTNLVANQKGRARVTIVTTWLTRALPGNVLVVRQTVIKECILSDFCLTTCGDLFTLLQ